MIAFLFTSLIIFLLTCLSTQLSYQNPVYLPQLNSPLLPSVLYDSAYHDFLLTLSIPGTGEYAVQILHSLSAIDWIQDGWAVPRLPHSWKLEPNSFRVARLLRTSYHGANIMLLVFSGTYRDRSCIGYGFTREKDYTAFSINESPIYCPDTDSQLFPALYQERGDSKVYLIWSEQSLNGDTTHVHSCSLILTRGSLAIDPNSKRVLLSAGRDWEAGVISSPQLFRSVGEYYYLFYSGGDVSQTAIGVARAKSISGPFYKFERNPILLSDPNADSKAWHSPSYPSVVAMGDSVYAVFYQAVSLMPSLRGNRSALMLDQLRYTREHWFQLSQVCGAVDGDWYPSACYHKIP